VLGELEGRKLLSNHRFAEMRVHILARKYGAAKIRQDLKSKGVEHEVSTEGELERARAAEAVGHHLVVEPTAQRLVALHGLRRE